MRWRQMQRTMFPNWLNVIVFVPAFLLLVTVMWAAYHASYQKAHFHPTQHYITSQSKR